MRHSIAILFFLLLSVFSFTNVEARTDLIEDLSEEILVLNEDSIYLPWDGNRTKDDLYLKYTIPDKNAFLKIEHNHGISLFIENQLYYHKEGLETIEIDSRNILAISDAKTVQLVIHPISEINKDEIRIGIFEVNQLEGSSPLEHNELIADNSNFPPGLFLFLFFVLGLVKFNLKREFDFYFSGQFLSSPRLTLEKFLGDSLNPFLLILSILLSSIFIAPHIEYNLNFLESSIDSQGLMEYGGLFHVLYTFMAITGFLLFKRTAYWLYTWLIKEGRLFSSIWRNCLLVFCNLSFWFFIIYGLALMLFPNLEFDRLFKILFFIFAALNAIGGITIYSNLRMKIDMIAISGILAVEIFPILLLIQLLTF